MPRKKNKSKNVSDEDEDEIPLKVLKRNKSCDVDPHSYDSLCMPSKEPCELCDRISDNKYHSLIHNVRHIIIPLLNQKVCQCRICLYYFTSQNDLKRHMAKKHTLKELVAQTDLVSRDFNNPKDGSYDTDLISIVKEEAIDNLDPIDLSDRIDLDSISDSIDSKDNIFQNKSSNCSTDSFSLKNRLIFEEDIISLNSDRLLTDLTTDCQVKVELFPFNLDDDSQKSVGYEELIKPGVFRCRKCGKTFPSRYESIIHEAHHININTNLCKNITYCKPCNVYIVGDITKIINHNLITHSKKKDTANRLDVTRRQFGGQTGQNGVVDDVTKVKTLKLCEKCLSFCKSNAFISYNCIEELRTECNRYKCDKCGAKFFHINLVNRETKYTSFQYARKNHRKGMSNEDRLKMIRRRLKMMKKFYFVVLFV